MDFEASAEGRAYWRDQKDRPGGSANVADYRETIETLKCYRVGIQVSCDTVDIDKDSTCIRTKRMLDKALRISRKSKATARGSSLDLKLYLPNVPTLNCRFGSCNYPWSY